MKLGEELAWRGLIKDKTFSEDTWLDKPQTFYHGVDGSADSLTVGNLAALMFARHLMRGKWKAVFLVGGATSLIGDPGGKDEERPLQPREQVAANVAAIRAQIEKLFGGQQLQVVNNLDWNGNLKLLDFLRDTGKYYSVTELVQRDFIAERMGEHGSGISFAEFSYTLLQGYDFWHLFKHKNVVLQVGGSDQWGNMLSGVSLIRKKEGIEAHALSMPLIINKATGKKFGKTEGGAVWLDAKKTSPTQFYQFWINVTDEDVEEYLKIFTLLAPKDIEQIIAQHKKAPEERSAQIKLAQEVTAFVHGEDAMNTAWQLTALLTEKLSIGKVDAAGLRALKSEIASTKAKDNDPIAQTLAKSGLAFSNSEARRLLASGAVYINGKKAERENFEASDFINGRLLLRRGKAFKDSAVVELG